MHARRAQHPSTPSAAERGEAVGRGTPAGGDSAWMPAATTILLLLHSCVPLRFGTPLVPIISRCARLRLCVVVDNTGTVIMACG
jgi:hypothetical protein